MDNSALEQKVNTIEVSTKENTEQIREMKYEMIAIRENNKLNDYKFNQIMDMLTELNRKWDESAKIPNTRWNLVISTIITALIGGLVGMFVFKK